MGNVTLTNEAKTLLQEAGFPVLDSYVGRRFQVGVKGGGFFEGIIASITVSDPRTGVITIRSRTGEVLSYQRGSNWWDQK